MQTVSLMVGPLVAILDEFCIWAETKGRSQPIYSAPSCLRISHYFCAVFGLDSLDLIWINTLGKNGRHL